MLLTFQRQTQRKVTDENFPLGAETLLNQLASHPTKTSVDLLDPADGRGDQQSLQK